MTKAVRCKRHRQLQATAGGADGSLQLRERQACKERPWARTCQQDIKNAAYEALALGGTAQEDRVIERVSLRGDWLCRWGYCHRPQPLGSRAWRAQDIGAAQVQRLGRPQVAVEGHGQQRSCERGLEVAPDEI
eukprot:4051056-Pyramimonas_sp.AAC.1